MIFTKPLPYREALDYLQQKSLLPTTGRTAELEQLGSAITERAAFSAAVTKAEHIQRVLDAAGNLVSGQVDFSSQRLALKQFLQSEGYMPSEEDRGTLRDLSSDARIEVQVMTPVKMAQGYGYWKQGQDTAVLDAFPAQEFLRVEAREVPRTDWPDRFKAAGGDVTNGRMVALKNDPCWTKLSRFGQPYEPFDFGSGMGTEDRPRSEAIALGLIDRDTELLPQDRPFNQDLQATPEIRDDTLRSLLEETGLGKFDGGIFKFAAPSS